MGIFFWLEFLLLLYFIYVASYTVFFSLAGRFYKSKSTESTNFNANRFAVFIPAYKEDGVIVDIAKDSLNQDYSNYKTIIIADSLQQNTLKQLKDLPVEVIEVSFEKSTKVKALNAALAKFEDQFDYAIIIDADNVMRQDFISTLNRVHQLGFESIQGRRAAKNNDTQMALLDGLSEDINNHIMCKGSTALGLSSSLKGSGMSFKYNLLKRQLSRMESVGGFDRELELRLANEGYKSLYVDKAIIYDEKVATTEVFENQRKRWISSQFYYLKKYFFTGVTALLKGRFALFNSTILRNIQLPRLLNLGLLSVFTLVSTIFSFWHPTLYTYWLIVAFITFFGTLLAIPLEYFNKGLLSAILSLPKIFFKMLLLLFKLRGANQKFIHTPHISDGKDEGS